MSKSNIDNEDWLESIEKGALVAGMCFLGSVVVLLLAVLLSGCVSAPVAPNLKWPEHVVKTCPQKTLPPIAHDVVIDIHGDKISADAGGEQLLRYYALARELLR